MRNSNWISYYASERLYSNGCHLLQRNAFNWISFQNIICRHEARYTCDCMSCHGMYFYFKFELVFFYRTRSIVALHHYILRTILSFEEFKLRKLNGFLRRHEIILSSKNVFIIQCFPLNNSYLSNIISNLCFFFLYQFYLCNKI